jgi:filamentous hemagglutinin family protein
MQGPIRSAPIEKPPGNLLHMQISGVEGAEEPMPSNSIRKTSINAVVRAWAFIVGIVLIPCTFSQANPTGGVVTAGSASINSSPGAVIVSQTSNSAIINWQSFSINAGELTKFVQPSSSSVVLNRVLGGGESMIDGTLSGNGQVFLINANGILIGQTGLVNTNGFIASTRDIADSDFLAGNYHFTGGGGAGVQNLGTINGLGGDVILIGKTVRNGGTIDAANGTAGLAAGDDVLITQTGNQHVFVNASATATADAGQTGISNSGTIAAATAELRAANGNIYALAINNSGTIRATTVRQEGGDIYLTADNGAVENSGTLNASATAAGGSGGTVQLITGKNAGDVAIQTGSIFSLGGEGGQGGDAEVSGGGLELAGTVNLTAPGGRTGSILIDPTALTVVASGGTVPVGGFGSPPYTNPSDPGANDTVDASVVEALLGLANVTLNADANITISAGITWTSGNMLSLTTNNANIGSSVSTIDINAPISGVNGGLTISNGSVFGGVIIPTAAVNVGTFIMTRGYWEQVAGQHGVPSTLPSFTATDDFELQHSGSTFERFAGGTGTSGNPFQITDIYGLQGVGSPSSFFFPSTTNGNADYCFVLDNNIDATVTANWRQGDGFLPIGDILQPTTGSIGGTFNGAGFAIDKLTENYNGALTPLVQNDNGDVGLFSYTLTSAVIENLNLTNIVFSMTNDGEANGGSGGGFGLMGGLVANNNAILTNDTVSGTMGGQIAVAAGGLVGEERSATGNSITGCSSSVDLAVDIPATGGSVGGLVGDNEGTINTSFSTGSVTVLNQTAVSAAGGNGSGIGGFVGYEGSTGAINNSYETGNVTVTDFGTDINATDVPVGGFIGDADDGSEITSVYSLGVVSETATVAPNPYVGIFAGNVSNSSSISDVYAWIYHAGLGTAGGLVGAMSSADPNSITPIDTAPAILTSSTIDFIDGVIWFQAPTANGPTDGFPVLTAPPMPDTTTTTLAGPGSSTYGDSITLTATVADVTNPGTNPTGTVTFDEDNGGTLTILGTESLALTGGSDEATLTLAVPNQLDAGDYSLVAFYGGATGIGNSDSTASPLALTVAPKALVITGGSATKTYGSTSLTYSGDPYTATGLVVGTTDSVTAVTLTSAGDAATAGVNGGTPYSLVPSGAQGSGLGNYSITYANGSVTVTPAQLTVTASNQTVIVGGTVNTTPTLNTTYTVTGLQNTDQLGGVLATGPTLSSTQSTAATGTFNGAIVIGGSLNNGLGGNYTLTLVDGNLTVRSSTPDTTSISLSDSPGLNPTYGQSITLIATLSDLTSMSTIVAGGTVTFDDNGTMISGPVTVTGDTVMLELPSLLNASTTAYDFTASYSGAASFAASATASPLAVVVGQKALIITAGDATKTYGSSSLNYSGEQFVASGLVVGTGDSVTGVTLTSAGQAVTAGVDGGAPYAIIGSDALGTGLSNYSITYADGSLTVNPAPLTVTAGAATKTYGSTALTYSGAAFTTSGLLNGDTVTGVSTVSAGQAATAGVDGGAAYALSDTDAQGTGVGNYTITYAPGGTLVVTPAVLTLSASRQTVSVGGAINLTPTLNVTYTATGLQNGQQLGELLAAGPTLGSTQSTSAVGEFDDVITLGAMLNGSLGTNYTLNLVNGGLTVENTPPVTPTINPLATGLGLAQLAAFNQVGVTESNANFNELFGQSNAADTDNAGDFVQVATASGGPSVQYYQRPADTTAGETFHGIPVLAHASSFTVGAR